MTKADPFEFADGMVKQLLTLATASIGGIIAFFDDDKQPGVQLHGSSWLVTAIVLLAASVLAGIFTLGSLTAQLTKKGGRGSINATDVRMPAMIQMTTFALGVIAVGGEIVRLHWAWELVIGAIVVAYVGLGWWAKKKKQRQRDNDREVIEKAVAKLKA